MRLEVYDSENTDRLLGYLEVPRPLYGETYHVRLVPTADYIRFTGNVSSWDHMQMSRVTFRVSWRSVSHQGVSEWHRRSISREEWMVLETDETLETLRDLDMFFYPGEGSMDHNHRVNYY